MRATLDDREVTDADLDAALEDMLVSAQGLSAVLFGGSTDVPNPSSPSFAWAAYRSLSP